MNERSARVLELLTETYIHSAHPVASSLLAKALEVSSATVRHELAALEEAGYLEKPHTSAGRIPTRLAYKNYIKKYIPPRRMNSRQSHALKEQLEQSHIDNLWSQIARVMADLSGYAVVVHLPAGDSLRALQVHLSLLLDSRILAMVVLETGLVRQLFFKVSPTPEDKNLRQTEEVLNRLILPLTKMPQALTTLAQSQEDLATTLLALAQAWPQLYPPTLFSKGLTNLFNEPEAIDPQFVRQAALYVEKPLAGLAEKAIISEDVHLSLDDVLAVVASQIQWGQLAAQVMFLGPTRMRYAEVLSLAQGVKDILAS
ncbi:MAG: hypothetical protein R2880_10335 [Deinococcales bacterium]